MKTATLIFLYISVCAIIIAGFILQRKVNKLDAAIKDMQCPKAGNTLEAWVAKDLSDGVVCMYRNKPNKISCGFFTCGDDCYFLKIPSETFPDLTYENSPQKVRLTIEKI